ncbi:glucosamine-6-phosphate deaminase [Pseudozobellia thermophila]|uniref:Glucosamine-6-phosphate deaminase n=1 Tax=Pseudozobellia thermophila TaxID=192903 RepID=A0A1M6BBR4_9FLAO|nr:glucosamine-6-phosphate deaminase [Pseudozobellia thermophila]SHI46204.1 glucosamine-6-phosphate deaminase [Pseudozobellia thermophila]
MKIVIASNKHELGKEAAQKGADAIREALENQGEAHIIVATGASQFEMLAELVKANLDWSKVTGFHLDEYVGMPETHTASFRKYLKERFVDRVPIKAFHYIHGDAESPMDECDRLGKIISGVRIDVAFVGIGENAHLAFNDPPADFEREEAYFIADLDKACRQQQLGEGWFASLEEVPKQAISMSVKQILKSKTIIASVPDERKALAVKKTVESEVVPEVPATALKLHPQTWLYLDKASASLLGEVEGASA